MKTLPLGAALLTTASFCNGYAHAAADSETDPQQNGAAVTSDRGGRADKPQQGVGTLDAIFVYGEPDTTATATKLNLPVFETPQSVSVISRDQIEDFSLREVNDVLDYMPGVTVEKVETDRTYYTARGFDIVNFQYDGVGVPFAFGLNQGQEDTAIFEQVEVVKGASGLVTGLANPSATINFIRKRPTDYVQASAAVTVGEWDTRRIEGDLSGAINDRIRGRLVVAGEEGDSYLDRYSEEKAVIYGVIEADITDTTLVTLGHSYNNSDADAASSGGLPLFYSDGSLTDYPVSTNTAPDWAFWDVERNQTFVELAQQLGGDWTFKAIYTYNDIDQDSETFYLSGVPDPVTEQGLVGSASQYRAEDKQHIVDAFFSGVFSLGGREHELVAGVNLADIELTGRSVYASAWSGYDDPVGGDWAEGNTPRPAFDIDDPATSSTDIDQTQNSYYVSSRLNPTDDLSILLGARTVEIDQDGVSYGSSQEVSETETVPYIGATYNILDSLIVYSSYSEVFKAQTWVDENLDPLGPVEGESTEVGLKQELNDGRAVVTLALFRSRQENFGQFVGRDPDTQLNLYRGTEIESEGFEIEVSGEVLTGLNMSAGYTYLDIEDEDGNDTRTHIPTKLLKLAAAYQLPPVPALRVGGGVKWQNETFAGSTEVQDSYYLVDLFASYDLSTHLNVAVNVENLTDEKYLNSPQWYQAFHGAPRNLQASLTWHY
ncbi:MAG: TonB-dependent siderophore receptor [Marinobacter sp.]|uniref:TonB-dependent siderophore receptor n=1 Tax=Marinobacter sp. TaxID=50741 RepID=UPI00299DAE31|nr:TonB-dependent siderophore receptor [Marinobacter sp.]MDX1756509.1 TonB-dependent siderophore receptor [Marinobacter sp.]